LVHRPENLTGALHHLSIQEQAELREETVEGVVLNLVNPEVLGSDLPTVGESMGVVHRPE
jgi:hypothetical protein